MGITADDWLRFLGHLNQTLDCFEVGPEERPRKAVLHLKTVAIHRRMTQGTRSEGGRTWCERIWTVIATYEQ